MGYGMLYIVKKILLWGERFDIVWNKWSSENVYIWEKLIFGGQASPKIINVLKAESEVFENAGRASSYIHIVTTQEQ